MAARNADKTHDALARIRALSPKANVRFEQLDLASLGSVAVAAVATRLWDVSVQLTGVAFKST